MAVSPEMPAATYTISGGRYDRRISRPSPRRLCSTQRRTAVVGLTFREVKSVMVDARRGPSWNEARAAPANIVRRESGRNRGGRTRGNAWRIFAGDPGCLEF